MYIMTHIYGINIDFFSSKRPLRGINSMCKEIDTKAEGILLVILAIMPHVSCYRPIRITMGG